VEPVLVVVGGASGGEGTTTVDRLHRLVRELRIEHLVRFLPPVPHADLPEVYAAADVLLMPSRSESFGLAALEAQACGIPVVASAVGGLRHVVADGRSGLLVEELRPEAFAARIATVLRDRPIAARLGRGGIHRAGRLSWDRTTTGVLAAYAELHPPLAAAAAG
jgi:D-inositol-3-phosphate glycosyltransferase